MIDQAIIGIAALSLVYAAEMARKRIHGDAPLLASVE